MYIIFQIENFLKKKKKNFGSDLKKNNLLYMILGTEKNVKFKDI